MKRKVSLGGNYEEKSPGNNKNWVRGKEGGGQGGGGLLELLFQPR